MVKAAQFEWGFDVPVQAMWRVMADTARFNEAAGFPRHQIEEIPQADGSMRFVAHARLGPFPLSWDDHPQNWVENRWFRHLREFRNGPIKSLCATLLEEETVLQLGWRCEEIVVYESHLRGRDPVYKPLETFSLGR